MKLINEAEIFDTWSPIIEQKAGITDPSKKRGYLNTATITPSTNLPAHTSR